MKRLFCALGITAVFATMAEAQNRPLTYDDYYRIERAGATAVSPDGSKVAFVRSRVLEQENRTHSEVWLVDADGGSEAVRLTSPATEASSPMWSPDGSLLAFSSRRDVPGADAQGSTWFLRMDRPGEAFQISGLAGSPNFDPTNRWIAFTRPVAPAAPPADPTNLTDEERRIVERFDGRAYDWMQFRFDRRGYLPDPTDPQATPPAQIFVLPREGGEARQITNFLSMLPASTGGPMALPSPSRRTSISATSTPTREATCGPCHSTVS